jgi:transposase
MKNKVRFLGLDVHAETIAVAIAEPDDEVRSLGTITNPAESIRKLVKKLGPVEQLKACYEAGPIGYVLYWQLAELGVACEVIAPTLVPMKAGDRVKSARARCRAIGAQLPVRRSDCGVGSGRGIGGAARSGAGARSGQTGVPGDRSSSLGWKQDQLRARHRLAKFLLRMGRRPAVGMKAWTAPYMAWVRQVPAASNEWDHTRSPDFSSPDNHVEKKYNWCGGEASTFAPTPPHPICLQSSEREKVLPPFLMW